MSLFVVLDTGPLGLVTNPRGGPEYEACSAWFETLLRRSFMFVVPEIADYELRRELLRAAKRDGLRRLNALVEDSEYLPLTTAAMRRAAEYWARARQQGRPTADAKALDGDAILAAQTTLLQEEGRDVVIAATNVSHLSPLAPARMWREIS